MTTREYLQKIQEKNGTCRDVTFIIARAVKDTHSPFYHHEFYGTPIRSVSEWLRWGDEFLDEHLVINADHPPIDVTGHWINKYKRGWVSCAMLTTEADLQLLYPGQQAVDMANYYRRTVTI